MSHVIANVSPEISFVTVVAVSLVEERFAVRPVPRIFRLDGSEPST